MAHHIAELVFAAENAIDSAERAQSEERAATAILRLWEHRASYKQVNPLTGLVPVLNVLRLLDSEAPLWGHAHRAPCSQAARQFYDLLRRLAISLSLWEMGGIDCLNQAIAHANQTGAWQSKEESEIVGHLSKWADSMPAAKKAARRKQRKTDNDPSEQHEVLDFEAITRQILDELDVALMELRGSLPKRETSQD